MSGEAPLRAIALFAFAPQPDAPDAKLKLTLRKGEPLVDAALIVAARCTRSARAAHAKKTKKEKISFFCSNFFKDM